MRGQYRTVIVMLVAMTAVSSEAADQSVEAARAARERAKADLIRAQEVFERADDAYIRALGGAANTPSVPQRVQSRPASSASSFITFTMSGVGALDASPFDYRARLIIDEQPGDWTEHVSGAKYPVPAGARSVAYEVQNNTARDPDHPAWRAVCRGNLPLNGTKKIEVVVTAAKIACTAS